MAFLCAEPGQAGRGLRPVGALQKDAFAVIWTTTAWTIPANQALNLNPALEYALVDTERGLLVLAASLVDKCMERYGLTGTVLATTLGERLGGLNFRHPLAAVDAGYDRLSPVFLADYATADDGTGIVHSSPAYGLDDFNSCVAHGMQVDDILNPVGAKGSYAEGFPLFGGLNIWKAVPVVIEALRNAGRLLTTHDITHSYPHCWRHKSPVIYRAAAQWFVRMDEGEGVFTKDKAAKTLRQLALDAIDQTGFYPENGRARLRDMIANRPDWCISRQRSWGVPLPFFLHRRRATCTRARWRSSTRRPTSWKPAASRPGAASRPRTSWAPTTPRTTARAATSSRCGSTAAAPSGTCCAASTRAATTRKAPRPTCTWKATTSTAAGSTAACCWPARCTAARPTAAC